MVLHDDLGKLLRPWLGVLQTNLPRSRQNLTQ